jgi:hypothetical protein
MSVIHSMTPVEKMDFNMRQENMVKNEKSSVDQ